MSTGFNLKEICYLEGLGVYDRKTLRFISHKLATMVSTGFMRAGIGPSGGFLWTWQWISEFTKSGEFLEQLSNYYFLKNESESKKLVS